MPSIGDLLPPVLKRPALRLTYSVLDRFGTGRFATYGDAFRACRAHEYQSEALVAIVVEKTRRMRALIEARHYTLDFGATRLLFALSLALRERPGRLRVLEFGGAAGGAFFVARHHLPKELELNWHVVETSAMARGAGIAFGSDELSFGDSLDCVDGTPDLVYSSGTLQCVPDPFHSLARLSELQAPWMLLSKLGLHDAPTPIVLIQRARLSENGPGSMPPGMRDGVSEYPVTISPRAAAERLIQAQHEIVARFDETDHTYTLRGRVLPQIGYLCTSRRSSE